MPHLTHKEIGCRVGELRRERDLPQRRLAELIGIDPSALSRVESGERTLAVHELVAIADVLGVPADRLLREDGDPMPLYRNDGGEAEAREALGAFERVIDDFFALEAVARA